MTYRWRVSPQYSLSEIDGSIGCIGYLRYFQDISAMHLHDIGKGNDAVPRDYGVGWIVSKYHLQVIGRATLAAPLTIETWIEPERSKVRIHPNLLVADETGTVLARGQMEMCLAHVQEGEIALLTDIDFPFEACEETGINHPKTRKLRFADGGMEYVYSRTVRYSDLDNNRHMNNLHHVDLVLDAFPSEFHLDHPITEFELEYLGQCREGDVIDVYRQTSDTHAEVLARNESGEVVLKAALAF